MNPTTPPPAPDELFSAVVDLMAEAVVNNRWTEDEFKHYERDGMTREIFEDIRQGDKGGISDEMADALSALLDPECRPVLEALLESWPRG